MVCGCARSAFGQVHANVSIEIRDILRQHSDVSMAFSRHHRSARRTLLPRLPSPLRVNIFKCCGRVIAGCGSVRAQNAANVRFENSSICINLENYTTCDCCHSKVTFMHCALRRSVVTRSCSDRLTALDLFAIGCESEWRLTGSASAIDRFDLNTVSQDPLKEKQFTNFNHCIRCGDNRNEVPTTSNTFSSSFTPSNAVFSSSPSPIRLASAASDARRRVLRTEIGKHRDETGSESHFLDVCGRTVRLRLTRTTPQSFACDFLRRFFSAFHNFPVALSLLLRSFLL